MFTKLMVTLAVFSAASVANAIELTDFKDANTVFDEAYVYFMAS